MAHTPITTTEDKILGPPKMTNYSLRFLDASLVNCLIRWTLFKRQNQKSTQYQQTEAMTGPYWIGVEFLNDNFAQHMFWNALFGHASYSCKSHLLTISSAAWNELRSRACNFHFCNTANNVRAPSENNISKCLIYKLSRAEQIYKSSLVYSCQHVSIAPCARFEPWVASIAAKRPKKGMCVGIFSYPSEWGVQCVRCSHVFEK